MDRLFKRHPRPGQILPLQRQHSLAVSSIRRRGVGARLRILRLPASSRANEAKQRRERANSAQNAQRAFQFKEIHFKRRRKLQEIPVSSCLKIPCHHCASECADSDPRTLTAIYPHLSMPRVHDFRSDSSSAIPFQALLVLVYSAPAFFHSLRSKPAPKK